MATIGKRRARDIARAYAAEQLRAQDEPGWPLERGLIDRGDVVAVTEFMDELRRIADRVESTITDAGRAALAAKEDQR